jgi:hypothetical protein
MDGYGDDFGSIFDDAWDVVTSAVSGVESVIPDFAKDAFNKFANTAIGHVVLFAISGSAFAALVPSVGPQLAAVAFALPGMAKGDNFMKAWTDGFMERITLLINYFAGGGGTTSGAAAQAKQDATSKMGLPADPASTAAATQQVANLASDQMAKLTAYVASIGGPDKLGNIDFQTLAQRAGVREDFAAQYLANAVGNLTLPKSYSFDPATGKATGKILLSVQDKARLIAASVVPQYATSAVGKGRAIGNIAYSQAMAAKQAQARGYKPPASKVTRTTVGAGLGLGGALLLGANLPVALGAAAVLGLAGLFTAKGV